MRLDEILDVDVVSNARAVRGRVVVSRSCQYQAAYGLEVAYRYCTCSVLYQVGNGRSMVGDDDAHTSLGLLGKATQLRFNTLG
jgi:hypothetical protein